MDDSGRTDFSFSSPVWGKFFWNFKSILWKKSLEIAEGSVWGKIPFVAAFVCLSPEEIQVPQGWNDKRIQFGFDIPQDDNSSGKMAPF